MYNVYDSEDNAGGKGTTNLHLDMTDAVNPADLPRVRRFLRKIAKERGNHPIYD